MVIGRAREECDTNSQLHCTFRTPDLDLHLKHLKVEKAIKQIWQKTPSAQQFNTSRPKISL